MYHLKLFENFGTNEYIVYHGSDMLFDEFKIGNNQHGEQNGKGIYFTNNLEYAKQFGSKIYKCQITLDNPFDLTIKDMSHL